MTARRKEGMTAKKTKTLDKTITAAEVVDIVSDAFRESAPELSTVAVMDLFQGAFKSLRHYLTKGNVAGVNWKNPFVQLDYDAGEYLRTRHEVKDGQPGTPEDDLAKDAALDLAKRITRTATSCFMVPSVISTLTREVIVIESPEGITISLPPDLDKEVKGLPDAEWEERLASLAAGFELSPLDFTGTHTTDAGKESFAGKLIFAVRPLTIHEETDRAFFPVMVGLDLQEGKPETWSEEDRQAVLDFLVGQIDALSAPYLKRIMDRGEDRPDIPKPDRAVPIRAGDFAVAGTYTRSIFSLSKHKKDMPLLLEFHDPQTPLNWAVGHALFSLTDEDRVRSGDWQEASIAELEDLVFCLVERDAPRRGDHRTDILAEVVKLHTTKNHYYSIETVKVGRSWTKRAVIGSEYAIPQIQLVFLDTKTGKTAFPTDPALRALSVPLEVKGRRAAKPDGKDILALPTGKKGQSRWKLESIRWRWVQSFNDDLILSPALEESGKRKGLPKKTVKGNPIRKSSGLIRVTRNIFGALHKLRAEGRGALYASRLLVILAHDINRAKRPEVAADRLFRMLGIPEAYQEGRTRKSPEDLVAEAVLRLQQRDIAALKAGSDQYPRTDPNPDRRKGPYYRLILSPEYLPRTGIASKEDALAIEAEYADAVQEDTDPPSLAASPEDDQAVLPGLDVEDAPPIPDGSVIRAAREAAGLNLRDFARQMDGPSFKTWSRYEHGDAIKVKNIPDKVRKRVREFVEKHGPKKEGTGSA